MYSTPEDAKKRNDYTEYMTKYADAMNKLKDIGEEEEMSENELKYYTDVMYRINQKLLKVATP